MDAPFPISVSRQHKYVLSCKKLVTHMMRTMLPAQNVGPPGKRLLCSRGSSFTHGHSELKSSKLPVKQLSRLRLPGLLQRKRPKEWLSRKKPRESLPFKKQRELQLNRRLPGSLLKKKPPELPARRRLSVSLPKRKPKPHVLKLREQRLLPRLRLKPAVPLKRKLLSSPRMPKMLLKRPRRRNRLD